MLISWLKQMSPKQTPAQKRPPGSKARRHQRIVAALEPLDPRVMLAVTASFSAAAGELHVTGDDQDNVIIISRTPAGAIVVNNGAVPILGDVPTVANTNHFHIVALGGNDTVTIDESNGPLPAAAIFGGAGNDSITGGS